MKQAEALAEGYQVILENDADHWYGRGLELPHVMADGSTPDECIAAMRSALAAAVAYLLEQGQQPPPSARAGRRTQQVNVRLTVEEKTLLASVARSKGYQGLGDYLRSAALETAERA